MDPITHTALGAALGYVFFHRRIGRSAAAIGALAGAAPDVDVFIRSATDPLLAVELHRHFTHALPFAPIGAFMVASVWMFRSSFRDHRMTVWLCSLAAYISHCLLDAATSYGTLLLWPFTRERFGWDWISIIDLLFTVPLALLLIVGLKQRQARWVQVGLVWCGLYMSLGAWQHHRALKAQLRLATLRGQEPDRREIMPTIANNVVWRSLYLADGQLYSDRIRVGWFSAVSIQEGTHLPLVRQADLTPEEVAAEPQGSSFARFYWFSEGWVARSNADPSLLGDMCYSLSTDAFDPVWGIRFTDGKEPPIVEWVNRSRDRRIDGAAFLAEIIGRTQGYRSLSDMKEVR